MCSPLCSNTECIDPSCDEPDCEPTKQDEPIEPVEPIEPIEPSEPIEPNEPNDPDCEPDEPEESSDGALELTIILPIIGIGEFLRRHKILHLPRFQRILSSRGKRVKKGKRNLKRRHN